MGIQRGENLERAEIVEIPKYFSNIHCQIKYILQCNLKTLTNHVLGSKHTTRCQECKEGEYFILHIREGDLKVGRRRWRDIEKIFLKG